jgi:hypothetical protein
LVYHTGKSLPLKVLTNSAYESLLEFYNQGNPHPANDYCTWARFCRVAELLENYTPAEDGPALEYAWSIHAAVHNQGRTRWTLLFDLKKLRFYFKTDINSNVRYVDLKSFDFSCDTPVIMLDANADYSGNVHQYFTGYYSAINYELIKKMAEAHGPITGTVSEWYIENSARYPETTSCNTTSGDLKEPEKK